MQYKRNDNLLQVNVSRVNTASELLPLLASTKPEMQISRGQASSAPLEIQMPFIEYLI